MKWESVRIDKKELSSIPSTPGVYMFSQGGTPLYIGKSVNLKARVKSHIQNAKVDKKEKSIIDGSSFIKYTTVDNDFKALLLEAKLIQEKLPKYNVELKDDKSYLYVAIDSKNEYPKVRLLRKTDIKTVKKSKYKFFGPFPSNDVAQEVLDTIRRLIPFCTNKNIGKRACFYSRIGKCHPCPNKIENTKDQKEQKELKKIYRRNVQRVIKVLVGKTDPVINEIKDEMQEASRNQEYESALLLRKKIERFQRWIDTHAFSDTRVLEYNQTEKRLESLEALLKGHFPEMKHLKRIECYDASTLLFQHNTASMVVLTEGAIDKSQYRRFKIKNPRAKSDFHMLKEALKRRFNNKWEKPDLIVIDGGKPQVRAAREVLDQENEEIPLIGLAKGPDRIVLGVKYLPTIRPNNTSPGFNLLKLIRDESHRFANSYSSNLRDKSLL